MPESQVGWSPDFKSEHPAIRQTKGMMRALGRSLAYEEHVFRFHEENCERCYPKGESDSSGSSGEDSGK